MEKYSTKRAGCVQKIETLGGDYALKWDDETQMSVNAYAALLSQFAKAGGFFDRLVETCPMRLTSNNAPEVRDLVATVMVSMVNGATRFRHFDRLHGDAATAELFGVGRFMSCDSVRRNFASIPEGQALPWVWRENLRLLQDVMAEDYILDLDPTVKPLYGHQEGAGFGYNPQKPGRPSHCYHTLCIAKLRLTLAVVVHPGNETSGTHSRSMLAETRDCESAAADVPTGATAALSTPALGSERCFPASSAVKSVSTHPSAAPSHERRTSTLDESAPGMPRMVSSASPKSMWTGKKSTRSERPSTTSFPQSGEEAPGMSPIIHLPPNWQCAKLDSFATYQGGPPRRDCNDHLACGCS